MPTTIYKITDPRNEKVVYVGITDGDLQKRLKEHMCDTRRKETRPYEHYVMDISDRARWFREMNSWGVIPTIETLEVCESRLIAEGQERFWIRYLKAEGYTLKNTAGNRKSPFDNYDITKPQRQPRRYR